MLMTDGVDMTAQFADAKANIESILADLASKLDGAAATPSAPLTPENTAATIEAAVKASVEKHVHAVTAAISSEFAAGKVKAASGVSKVGSFLTTPTPLWVTIIAGASVVAALFLR
jgi:hypothetical protein